MSATLERIEKEVLHLTAEERAELQEFLGQVAEDELELTDEFKAQIATGFRQIEEGLGRVRQP